MRAAALSMVVISAVLTACGGGDSGPTELALTRVTSSALGAVQPGSYVVRSRPDWEAFWAAHPHPSYSSRQIPAVDFANSAVAGIFAGPKPRCKRLDIVSGSTHHGTVTLRYQVVTFGAGTPSSCLGNDSFTLNLAEMVLVPRESVEVKFVAEDG